MVLRKGREGQSQDKVALPPFGGTTVIRGVMNESVIVFKNSAEAEEG